MSGTFSFLVTILALSPYHAAAITWKCQVITSGMEGFDSCQMKMRASGLTTQEPQCYHLGETDPIWIGSVDNWTSLQGKGVWSIIKESSAYAGDAGGCEAVTHKSESICNQSCEKAGARFMKIVGVNDDGTQVCPTQTKCYINTSSLSMGAIVGIVVISLLYVFVMSFVIRELCIKLNDDPFAFDSMEAKEAPQWLKPWLKHPGILCWVLTVFTFSAVVAIISGSCSQYWKIPESSISVGFTVFGFALLTLITPALGCAMCSLFEYMCYRPAMESTQYEIDQGVTPVVAHDVYVPGDRFGNEGHWRTDLSGPAVAQGQCQISFCILGSIAVVVSLLPMIHAINTAHTFCSSQSGLGPQNLFDVFFGPVLGLLI